MMEGGAVERMLCFLITPLDAIVILVFDSHSFPISVPQRQSSGSAERTPRSLFRARQSPTMRTNVLFVRALQAGEVGAVL